MFVDSISMLSTIHPFTLVIISIWRNPYSFTIFFALFPITFKNLSIIPLKPPFTLPQTILEISGIDSIFVLLISLQFFIILKNPLKNVSFSDENRLPFSNLILYLSKVNSQILIGNNLKLRIFHYLL